MRAALVTRSCVLLILACAAPALAQDNPAPLVMSPVVAPAPMTLPEMYVAAQKAETLQAIANMRARLAELVPFQTRNDAVSQTATTYAAHWSGVVDNFANMQMEMVDAMIIGLNEHHQDQITDYMNAEHLVPQVSLFDDPVFLNMIQMPIDFANPLPTEAGFFGS